MSAEDIRDPLLLKSAIGLFFVASAFLALYFLERHFYWAHKIVLSFELFSERPKSILLVWAIFGYSFALFSAILWLANPH
jgi:hypothetical protein